MKSAGRIGIGAHISRRVRSIVSLGGRRTRRKIVTALALVAMLVQLTPWRGGAIAMASDTFIGSTDGVWDTAGNWSAGIPTAGTDVIFPTPIPAGGGTITLASGDAAKSLTFQDLYSLTGGDLTLGLSGSVTVATGSTVTIGSILGGAAGTAGGLTLAADNGLAGGDLVSGGGTLILTGTNTYAGATRINAGALSITSAANLGDGSLTNTIAIANNASLATIGTIDLGVNRSIAVGDGGGTFNVAPGGVLTVSGPISGSSTLTKANSGTMILTADNSAFTGNVVVDSAPGTTAGVLRLANSNALTNNTVTLNNSSVTGGTGTALDLANVTMGTGVSLVMNSNNASGFRTALTASTGTNVWNGGVTLNGDGLDQMNVGAGATLTVNGAITGASGFTGTLFIRGTGAGTINGTINMPTGILNKTDGGTWTINSPSQVVIGAVQASDGVLKLGATDIIPTNLVMTMGQGSATNGQLDLAGFNQTFQGLQLATGSTSTGTRVINSGAGPSVLTLNGGGTYATNSIIGNTGTANISLVLNGTGSQTLSGNSVFTGGTTLNSGTLQVGNNGAVGVGIFTYNGGVVASNGAGNFALTNSSLVLNNDITFGVAGNTGSATLAGPLNLSGTTHTFTAIAGGGGFSGLVSNGGIIKNGSGTLVLSSATANTFAGGLTINDGLVQGNTAVDNFGNAGVGTITINGGGISSAFNGTFDPAATRIFNFTGVNGPGQINITNAGSTGKILIADANQLTGSAAITKTGPGTLQINVANNLTGNWTIAAGQVEMQNAAALGSGTITVTGNGTTTNTASGELVVSSVTVGGTNNITLNGGILGSNNQAALSVVNSNVNVAGNSSIAVRQFQTLGNFGNLTINSGLTGSGNLSIVGPNAGTAFGTLTLNGNNSGYSGNVSIGARAAVQFNTNASVIPTVTLNGGRANYYAAASPATPNLGAPGINATYLNFGSNPTASGNPNNYVTDRLYVDPRSFSRVEANVNETVNSGIGFYPRLPVAGFGVGGTGGINDGIMYKGLLNITTAGSYQFLSAIDDQDILFIDGQQVGAHTGNTNLLTTALGTITLSAGYHGIIYKSSQGTGGGYNVLSYNGPDTSSATVVIPQSALNSGSFAPSVLQPTVITSGTGTLDVLYDSVTPSVTMSSGTGLSVLSIGGSNLTVSGATTLGGGTNTFSPTTGSLTFNGSIGESAGSAVTMAGPYLAAFNAVNTYSGLTTVTGGELDLNATGGNAIPSDLTINSANANGAIRNVRLLQSEQVSDSATVTMTQGILDLGANNETIGSLVMNGGRITGTGTLTVGVLSGSTLNAGTILANLAGSGGFSKGSNGMLTLAGNNTYTGVTTLNSGGLIRVASNGGLGAGGAGNETSISDGGQLQVFGGITIANENISVAGAGLLVNGSNDNTGALRNIGNNTLGGQVTLSGGTVIQSDIGRLSFTNANGVALSGALTVQGGGDVNFAKGVTAGNPITKTGTGTLFFGTDVGSSFPVSDFQGGTIGFSGTQSFGSYQIPSGRGLRFESNPGAGVTIDASNAGTAVFVGTTGGAGDQALVSGVLGRVSGNAPLVLAGNSGANIDFSAGGVGGGGSGMSLAALGLVTQSGTITPNAGAYQFSAQTVTPNVGPNVLTLTKALTGASNSVNVSGGILDLTASNNDTGTANLFGGGLNVSGGTVRGINDPNLGAAGGSINLNGGTLQIAQADASTVNVATLFGYLGTGINNSARTINVGTNGGTIDVVGRTVGTNGYAVALDNKITGSGTLTKSGYGQLLILGLQDGTAGGFSGNLIVSPNSGQFNILAGGGLRGLSGITVNTASNFQVDNNTTMGAGREFVFNARVNGTEGDKIGDNIPITLQGGTLLFQARNIAFAVGAGNFERVGNVTAGFGQSNITATSTGLGGADFVLTNLIRNVGGGTVRINPSGTAGATGSNGRIILPALADNAFPGAWMTLNGTDYAINKLQTTAGGAGGLTLATYTALTTATAPNTNGFTSGTIGTAAANVVLGAAGAGQVFTVGAMRFNLGAAQTLTFAGTTGTPDTLYVESGGILSDGTNFTRAIGANTSAFTRGILTAGTATATTPQELFLHNNQNTMSVFSQIIDNPAGGTVAVVKDLDGTVVLDAGTSTYTGGTNVFRGTLTANNTGSLGSMGGNNTGIVNVKNSVLNLGNKGSVGGSPGFNTAVYLTSDQSQIVLTNGTAGAAGAYDAATDRFNIAAGSSIYGNSPGTGFGLNSLTRVDTPTSFNGGGQVYLAPDAVVKHNLTNAPDQGTGNLTIKNLGTNADLYFAPGNNGGVNQTLTVGINTPWKGLGSDRGTATWTQGTIVANSDFWLTGFARDGGLGVIQLGADGAVGGMSIVNNAGKPINAYVQGQLVLQKDTGVSMPADLTFVLTPGSIMQPNRTGSLGVTGSTASVRVQAGATLDPGPFASVGAAANQDTTTFQNLPYPVQSPVNGSVVVEAGGRFLLNDGVGIGSAPVGSYLLKADSVLDLATATAFGGRGNQPYGGAVDTTGYALPGQFTFEKGAIVRLEADPIKISSFVTAQANGEQVAYELYNGNRTLTNQNNVYLKPVVGTPTISPENIRISGGGIITNDASDRTLLEGRGRVFLGDGAILAGTSGTYMNIQESFEIDAGANVFVGTTRYVDGMPKLGGVNIGFTGPNGNTAGAGAKITVVDGAQAVFGAANVIPDTLAIDLPAAVTQFPAPTGSNTAPSAQQPNVGSSILLNTANFAEVMGKLTGNGAIIGGAAGAGIAAGFGATSDFTFNGVFKSTNGQNPELFKVGTTKMTLTGSSDATVTTGVLQGTLELSGAGNTKFLTVRSMKGGTLSLDNSGQALNNRTGNPSFWTPAGGSYNLIGNGATPVTETVQAFANSVGAGLSLPNVTTGYTFVNVTPGAATTTLVASTLENFQSAGVAQQKGGTWVIRTPAVNNLPGSYGVNGALIPNATNQTNGLFVAANPNFTSNGGFGINAAAIVGQGGTPVAPVRGDYLGDASTTGQGVGFLTADAITYQGTFATGSNSVTGLNSTANLAVGMPVVGAGIPAGTTITAINSSSSITLSANTTAAGSAQAINFTSGGMRLLTANEYAAAPVNNLTTSLNVKTTGTVNTTGDTRFESLTMTPGSTLTIGGTLPLNSTPSRAVVNSGGVFVQAGGAAATINGGANNLLQATASNGSALFLHAQGDLNLNAQVFTDTSVVKTGAGTLNVGAGAFGAFRGSLQVDGGTVNLGANNSLATIRGTTGFTAPSATSGLFINGGTLNLNGNSMLVGQITNNNPLFAQGGTITSATPATITTTAGGQFSGAITGAISIDKVNNVATTNTTQTFTNDNTYTGSTVIRGGTLNLRDGGKLSGTSNVDLYYGATLQLDNSYLGNGVNRINPAAVLNVRGGSIQMTGAPGQVSSQTLATVNLLGGRLDYNANAGGSGAIEFTAGNFVRGAGTGSTFTINQNFGFTGTTGNNSDAIRFFINKFNGSNLVLNDGLIGGWAVMNGGINGAAQFMTYNPAVGVGTYSNTADGFANYESGDLSAATATQNVNDGTARTITASKTVNSLRQTGAITSVLTGNVTLTLDTGGYLTDTGNAVNLNGFYGAKLTSNSGELDMWVSQNTTTLNVPVTGNIDLVKSGGGTLTLNPTIVNTLSSTTTAGTTVTVPSTAGLTVGMTVTGTNVPAGDTIASITNGTTYVLTTAATAAATNTLTYGAGGGQANSYTGKTFVNSGTLNLSLPTGNGTTLVSVPGDLVLQNGTVTETVINNIKATSNVTINGGGRLNMVAANGITETLQSITFADAAGATAIADLDRTATETASVLRLTAPTAITATNTNPSNVPNVGGFLGSLAFTPASGTSTIVVNSPVTTGVNNAIGLNAVGLKINSAIGNVPTIAEGGLIKAGTGYLVLGPDQTVANTAATITAGSNTILTASTVGLTLGMPVSGTGIPTGSFITSITSNTSYTISNAATAAGSAIAVTGNMVNFNQTPISYNGTLASLTDVFNISSGVVRFDNSQALGSNSANTTVQAGAVLLGNGGTLNGSLRLKDGSTLGLTIASSAFGNPTTTVNNQSVMNIPGGNVTFSATDYFVQSTNGGTLTINSKLTGAGNINIVGPQQTGSTGAVVLANLLTGATAGANDYSGTITVNTNAILRQQQALLAPATSVTGNTLGNATINLNGGRLSLRDDFSTTNAVMANQTATYGNNVILSGDSFLDANRASALTTIVNNTIALGTLTVPSGSKVLNVDSGNGYGVTFAQLDGAGTLVKAGLSTLNINGYAGTFTGGFTLAGPQGRGVAGATGVNFVATNNTFANMNIGGALNLPGGKTFNVPGTLSVDANAGNYSGTLAVPSTATVTAGTFNNDGQVGATVGAATITANTFTGSGVYVTQGQNLTLAGNVNAGTLRTSGNATINLAGTSLATAGIDVQSGSLRIAPTAPLASSGNIRVLSSPALTVGADKTPVAAVSGVLNFDGGANAITHTGNITNSSIVRVSSGTASVSGVISGSTQSYVPGLLEGYTTVPGGALDVSPTRAANPGTFGIRLEPRMLQANVVTQQALTGHTDNDTWVYTGYVKDDDGVFSFAENIDDRAAVWIDGNLVLNAANGGTSRVVSTAFSVGQTGSAITFGSNLGTPSQNFGPGVTLPGYGSGWHQIEIRMNNGGGGAGPITGNGFGPNYGFGYKNGIAALDGADMIKPIDDGTGNLFVTPVNAKGTIDLLAGTTLNAGGFALTNNVNLPGTATFNVTAAGANDADNLNVTGASGAGTFTQVAGAASSIKNVTVAAGTKLALGGAGSTTILTTLTLSGDLDVNGGTLALPITGTGTGNVTVNGGLMQTQATSNGVGGGNVAINNAGQVQVLGNGLTTSAITVNNTGLLSVTGSVASSSGVTVNDAARYEAVTAQAVKTLSVNGGKAKVLTAPVRFALTVGDGTATVSPLSLTGGTLDLTTNGVAIHYAAGNDAAVLASTRSQIIAGYNPSSPTAGDGKWDGATGITSSSIGSLNAVGYALAADVLPFDAGATTDRFMGTTVDKNTVVARYTLSGDLNLDGSVDFLDLARLAQSYNVTDGTRQWVNGDVNYDGNVDFLDLAKMAQNYNTALGAPAVAGASADFQADVAKAFAAVPEPGTISILGIGVVALLARRRNRRAA